jgi:hypothetical protein
MTMLVGAVLLAASLAVYLYSLPRGGRTARFVGSPLEGYIVVGLVCLLGLGLLLTITGAIELAKG